MCPAAVPCSPLMNDRSDEEYQKNVGAPGARSARETKTLPYVTVSEARAALNSAVPSACWTYTLLVVAMTSNFARGPYADMAAVLSPEVTAPSTVSPAADAKTFRIA